jgi:hypothetical protein
MDGAELDQFGGAHAEADENEVPVSSRGEPKGPPSACLFVASLAPETAEAALHTYFVQYGPILKVKLLKDKASRPYAFVQFMVRSSFLPFRTCLFASTSFRPQFLPPLEFGNPASTRYCDANELLTDLSARLLFFFRFLFPLICSTRMWRMQRHAWLYLSHIYWREDDCVWRRQK